MNTIKHCNAYYTYAAISKDAIDAIASQFAGQGLSVDVCNTSIEFEFEGRDIDNFIIQSFKKVALFVCEASGELRCELYDDEAIDPRFVFYTISDRKLFAQEARIVRSNAIEPVE